jgi:hypothetical protein
MEGLYLIWLKEYIDKNDNVYKIGRSYDLLSRLKSYPNGSEILFTILCSKSEFCEKKLIELFNEKFTLECKKEYFRGESKKMIEYIKNIIIDECNINDISNISNIHEQYFTIIKKQTYDLTNNKKIFYKCVGIKGDKKKSCIHKIFEKLGLNYNGIEDLNNLANVIKYIKDNKLKINILNNSLSIDYYKLKELFNDDKRCEVLEVKIKNQDIDKIVIKLKVDDVKTQYIYKCEGESEHTIIYDGINKHFDILDVFEFDNIYIDCNTTIYKNNELIYNIYNLCKLWNVGKQYIIQ